MEGSLTLDPEEMRREEELTGEEGEVVRGEVVRGERGGLVSEPEDCFVLLLSPSILLQWLMGKPTETASPTFLSARVRRRVHVTMSVFNSNGRGNFSPGVGGKGLWLIDIVRQE